MYVAKRCSEVVFENKKGSLPQSALTLWYLWVNSRATTSLPLPILPECHWPSIHLRKEGVEKFVISLDQQVETSSGAADAHIEMAYSSFATQASGEKCHPQSASLRRS